MSRANIGYYLSTYIIYHCNLSVWRLELKVFLYYIINISCTRKRNNDFISLKFQFRILRQNKKMSRANIGYYLSTYIIYHCNLSVWRLELKVFLYYIINISCTRKRNNDFISLKFQFRILRQNKKMSRANIGYYLSTYIIYHCNLSVWRLELKVFLYYIINISCTRKRNNDFICLKFYFRFLRQNKKMSRA